MTETLTAEDWEHLVAELREFAGEARVAVEDGTARAELGNAHVELTRAGGVRTGMALHGFEAEEGGELRFDHERGLLHLRSGDVEYTFRRP